MDQKIKDFIAKLNSPLSILWEESKVFLIVFGVLILIIKFHEIIFSFIVHMAKVTVEDAQKKDTQLKQQETAYNDAANQLLQKNEELDKNKPKVDEDWNKK